MTTLEKNDLKEAIREIVKEDKIFFRELLQELLAETIHQKKLPEQEENRAERFDAIIKRDFERYKNVFKALA